MARKPKKTGRKTTATPSATQVAKRAGCSRQLASRLLQRGMSEEQIIDRVRETKIREADLLDLPPVPVNGVNGHAAMSYSQAQAAKETALARLRELELMQRRGELIPVEFVRVWGMRFLVEGRDILLNGPGQLADTLAAESDPRVVEQTLRAWVDRSLERFFQLETLWGEPTGETGAGLRQRFDAAKLAVVKRPGNGSA